MPRRIAAIDGVAAVETRIASPVILDIPGLREPATGLAISIPESGDIAVNDLFLRQGRLPGGGRGNEVAVNWNFAEAHHFTVGSSFEAVVNGSKIRLNIVGIVLSPEYIYALGPGDMMPDNRRFGVMWMQEQVLAPLFNLDGAFNSVSLRLLPGASQSVVIETLDTLLEPYGGTGAYGRKDQLSNAFLDSELVQLKGMAEIIPPIFLAVSAFLINMILSRLIALEREQIGLLKALGYGRFAVVWHYLKLVLVIASIGTLIGIVGGNWLGRALTRLYAEFYSFPFLIFRETPDIYLIAVGISFAAAILGALRAVSTAFALPAAVAMRPPAPQVYRRALGGLFGGRRLFSQLTTMALRHVTAPSGALGRSPPSASPSRWRWSRWRWARSIRSNAMLDAIYYRTDRQDATLAFNTPRPPAVVSAALNLPGVMTAEPYLDHPVRMSNGHYSRQLVITGKPPGTDLSRVLDLDLKPVVLPPSGLALGDRVAEILHVNVGDMVRVRLLDGDRRTVEAPVTQIIQSYIGLVVYMDIDALARLAGTGPRVSGVHIALDSARLDDLYAAVKKTPQISSVALQTISRQRMQETMQQSMNMSLFVYFALAVIIAFGVVYNSARIQLSERARELASLRVLGFRRAEVSNILFIEVGVVVALAQPIGWLVGTGFGWLITQSLATDIFRVPFVIELRTYAVGTLVVAAAALFSAAIVRRRIDRFDLIRVLKTRE